MKLFLNNRAYEPALGSYVTPTQKKQTKGTTYGGAC
jgi:hypothetical protein